MALTNEGGIFAVLNGIIEGVPALAGKISDSVMGFANGVADSAIGAVGSVFRSVDSVSLGGLLSGPSESNVAQVRAPEIAPPVRGAHDVDPAELFTFSAPTFNAIPMASRETSQGASV